MDAVCQEFREGVAGMVFLCSVMPGARDAALRAVGSDLLRACLLTWLLVADACCHLCLSSSSASLSRGVSPCGEPDLASSQNGGGFPG